MKKHVTELRGPALDWAVAKVIGATFEMNVCMSGGSRLSFVIVDGRRLLWWPRGHPPTAYTVWRPSTDWSQAGPIIEEHWREIRLALEHALSPMWPRSICMGGSDTLVWFMRAYVLSKLGEEIDVPEELL